MCINKLNNQFIIHDLVMVTLLRNPARSDQLPAAKTSQALKLVDCLCQLVGTGRKTFLNYHYSCYTVDKIKKYIYITKHYNSNTEAADEDDALVWKAWHLVQ